MWCEETEFHFYCTPNHVQPTSNIKTFAGLERSYELDCGETFYEEFFFLKNIEDVELSGK